MLTLTRRLSSSLLAATAFMLSLGLAPAHADTVVLNPADDATMFSESTNLANGAGAYLFAGRANGGNLRRALMRFDLRNIPPGSTITSATLSLNLSRSQQAGTVQIRLHRVLESWVEGQTDATGQEGGGNPEPLGGDVTWGFRSYNTLPWSTIGGVYDATASASTAVAATLQRYSWSSAGLVADLQQWVNQPYTNFGWLIRSDETSVTSAKRFDSKEIVIEDPVNGPSNLPRLTINYTPPTGSMGACCFVEGNCVVTTSGPCAGAGGTYQGNGTSCSPNLCPQPTGACCLPTRACVSITRALCDSQAGEYQGDFTSCLPSPCTTTLLITTSKDNTLYSTATGASSNGAGEGMISGNNDFGARRRAVMAFDLSSIPDSATILSVKLRLSMTFNFANSSNLYSLYRINADWGQGTSDAAGDESTGVPSTPGDATWVHRFYPGSQWTLTGGTFFPTATDTLQISTFTGPIEWLGPGLLADVQSWVADPSQNFGWILLGNETTSRTARRFGTRENPDPALRPQLEVVYAAPPVGACCLTNGSCSSSRTQTQCATLGGTYQGNGTNCSNVDCPIHLEPFVDALPIPPIAQPVMGNAGGAAHYEIAMTEFPQQLHRDLPPTRVWGYAGSYPGPTIEARRDELVTVIWSNDLRDESGNLRVTHPLPVDTCLHGPDITGEIPHTTVHLHGLHVTPDSDGYPESSFPPGQQSTVYTYPNTQPATALWYHDHGLGITRLNVYMGLAGFYMIRDAQEESLNIPRGEYEIPLLIQDRSFHADGSLRYNTAFSENFFGDFILMNGKVWPYLNVKQGKYRFRMVNGSNSRTYTLSLSNGATFHQIGTDAGLLPAPVPLTSLTISPSERADFVIDFASYPPGTEIIFTNSAPAPFPVGGVGPDVPNVMKFIVTNQAGDTDPLPSALVPVPPIPESEAIIERPFTLSKVADPTCNHDMWLINDLMWDDITTFPTLGTTEIWSWINRSNLLHPMHIHLVSFQVLDRQPFEIVDGQIVVTGPRVPPAPNERGWKDTVQVPPQTITRVISRFEKYPGLFPYHCHILEHEDHEMMRQFEAVCPPITISPQPQSIVRDAGMSADFGVGATGYELRYRWRKDGQVLNDGPTGHGSSISGVFTQNLSITSVAAADAGAYDCIISDPCGHLDSEDATLTVPTGCPGDTNGDNMINSADLSVLLSQFGQSVTPGTGADFNGDGFVNAADLSVLLARFGTGC